MPDLHELRAAFAQSLSAMYGTEVPAYTTLVEVAAEVNRDVLGRNPVEAQRLGRIDRVTAERHGAIRVGTPDELRRVGQIFAGFGMSPVGFYDLRAAAGEQAGPRGEQTSLPIVSTAFRPTSREALAKNPFRVFTSVLVTDDRRYFDASLKVELDDFLARRTLFGDELVELGRRAEADGGLEDADASRFVTLATECFELSGEPVDRTWYERLSRVSGVAADIGGVTSTHINHLTPRVLDIDDLYRRMTDRGVEMIDEIQGPPRWDGPDMLLRQTSFKALAEPRRFRQADGSVVEGHLSVRFGEVEQRGIALTREGRNRYDRMVVEVDERARGTSVDQRDAIKQDVWREHLPATEAELDEYGLGFFEYVPPGTRPCAQPSSRLLADLVASGWLVRQPIVYEDFLPRSAAGIFASNLDDAGTSNVEADGSARDEAWLADVLGRDLYDPFELYGDQRAASLSKAGATLGLDIIT